MTKKFPAVLFLLFFWSANHALAKGLPAPFTILPQPQDVSMLSGKGISPGELRNIVLVGNVERPIMGRNLSALVTAAQETKGSVVLVLDPTVKLPSEEGYRLNISGGKVKITASGAAGLFYGCQSLEQLLEDAHDFNTAIPSCTITDYPTLSYRAVHFDVKHHLDHMNYYYESIDRLAKYKINAIVFEFEDKLRYQRQPLVGAPQAMSIDEMAALTRYARKRFIEITPLVQGLGHSSFILKHEEYAGLRELPFNSWAFCPLNEPTYQVLFDLYRDAIEATPGSRYLHVGGDEIGNIGLCPRCKPIADQKGMISLNLYWLRRVCEFARANNRIPIFWDDMPLQYAGLYRSTWDEQWTAAQTDSAWKTGQPKLDSLQTDFPQNCVYMRWNYSMATQPGNLRTLDWYKTHGLTSMIATATNAEGGMLFEPEERDKGDASRGVIVIKNFIELAAGKHIAGMLCTAWDDKSPHMENYWRGFVAAAEYSWHPSGRSLDEYDQAWLQREFSVAMPDYKAFNDQLRQGSLLWYKALYRHGDFFDDDNTLMSMKRVEHWLPPLANQENVQFDYTTKLIGLPDAASPGSWSKQYSDRLQEAAAVVSKYPALSKRLKDLTATSRRNRYYWQLSQAMYDFQLSVPRLLLALKESDSPVAAERQKGKEQVKQALLYSRDAFNGLKEAYAQTRFIAYPANYLPDRYFHAASQREDLSWMTQAQDLYAGMIGKWLEEQR